MKKKFAQKTFVIPTDNCLTLVILEPTTIYNSMVDDHGVIVLFTKKDPISSLHKLVPIILVIGITKQFTQNALI